MEYVEQEAHIALSERFSFENEEHGNTYVKIAKRHPFNNKEYKWQERCLAELFAECYGEHCRYCPEVKEWYVYDGTRWVRDVGAVIVSGRLKLFAELMTLYADNIETDNDDMLKKYQQFISKMGSRNVRDRILKDAQDETAISISEFDADPYLLNCQNGTYDLREGEFREHKAEDYLTMMTNCYYPLSTEDLKFDRWNQFIDEITCGKKEIAKYLQRALGYSLCGVAKEECMFIAYGKTTRNGKGTLFNTIHHILGDYARAASVEFICVSRNGRSSYSAANPMLADFKGTRFITLSESQDMAKLDEASIKNYTGNDLITTRQLYGKPFSYTPQFKMWLSCNSLPQVKDRSLFSSDRIKVIEFNRHFSEGERDVELKTKFATDEAKAVIFKWLIDGYANYYRRGLAEPKAVTQAIESYERDNDFVRLFVEERCELSEEARVGRNDLYTSYKSWCRSNGLNPMSSPRFKKSVEVYAVPIKYQGNLMWKGITISNEGGIKIK